MIFGNPNFRQAEAQAHDEIDEEFGECFNVVPMKRSPNKDSQRDTTRPVYRGLVGIFEHESRDARLGLAEMKVSSRDPCVTFHRCNLPYKLRAGDIVIRVDTEEQFEVTDTRPDSLSGLMCKLLQMGVTDQ